MSEKRLNILFLVPTLYGGGAEKVCCVLASELAKRHNVTIGYLIDYFYDNDKRYPLDERVQTVKIRRPGFSCPTLRDKLRYIYLCRKEFRRIKKERSIDVSISFLFRLSRYNVASWCGEKLICSERCNPVKYEPEHIFQTRILYWLSTHTVFQSELVRSIYKERRTQRRSRVIPNPVSVECLADEQRSHRIVTLGRLADQKNHAMLIRSFAAFLKSYPDYTLTIYGEGEIREELENLVAELGLGDRVFLPGNLEHIHRHIRDAEIFVLSSNYEGLSNSLLECMTMGIACVSTRCEGSTDVIRDGENGLLIDIGDGEALTEALCRLAGDPALRRKLEENARSYAARFEKESVAKEWEALML